VTGFEVFERPRAPKHPRADETAAAELRRAAEELRERAQRLDATAQILDPIPAPKIEISDAAGAATSAAEIFDLAVEAVAQHLESDVIHYTWNGNPRRPNNYRAAAADARTTPNPYRKADS
jgi:hypothetical protein